MVLQVQGFPVIVTQVIVTVLANPNRKCDIFWQIFGYSTDKLRKFLLFNLNLDSNSNVKEIILYNLQHKKQPLTLGIQSKLELSHTPACPPK